MPLPLSRSQLDKLGKRLAAGDGPPSSEERSLLQSVLAAYAVVLDEVVGVLRDLGFQPTSRVKTEDVLIEKLRRHAAGGSSMGLKGMQDIAGARIVVAGGRSAQDQAVGTIVDRFAARGAAPRVIDRRLSPSAGYRAIHIITQLGGLPTEIQVRTEVQDAWAQLVEALGDEWGRGIRYGEGPAEAHLPAAEGSPSTRAESWQVVLRLSDLISDMEEMALDAPVAVAQAEPFTVLPGVDLSGIPEVMPSLTLLEDAVQDLLEAWKHEIRREDR